MKGLIFIKVNRTIAETAYEGGPYLLRQTGLEMKIIKVTVAS